VLVCAALAVVTLLLYSRTFSYPFTHFDDPDYVTQNSHVPSGLTLDNVRWAFRTFECGNWHPLTWLSLFLDQEVYSGKPGGFHATNVLLHTASTLLLFLVLSRMTGCLWRSAFVAGLFALHPLNVEPVAWVAERKGVLSTFFWMLTLAAYCYYVRRPSVGRYLLVVASLVLGLMAKPLLLTLPFVLLLLDYWPLQRLRIRSRSVLSVLLEKLPLIAIVLAWSWIAAVSQHHIKALPSLGSYPLDMRLANALHSYIAYLGKMLWPADLAAYYPHPRDTLSAVQTIGSGGLLVLVTVLVLGPGRRWPYLAVGWLWYLLVLVPMIGLVQIGDHGMADRYTYVPLVGVFLALTWGAADLAAARGLPRLGLGLATVVVLLICAGLTWKQLGYWKDDRSLWEHTLAVTQNNALAHSNLGTQECRDGRLDRAETQFAAAVAIEPTLAFYHYNYATVLRDLGHREEAIAECRRGLALDPNDGILHLTYGDLLWDQGFEEEALAELDLAAKLSPDHPLVHHNIGNHLRELGRNQEALAEYKRSITLDREYASPHIGMGNALAELGRREEARTEFRRALELDPDNALATLNLGVSYQADGRFDEALAAYRQAEKLQHPQAAARLRGCERLKAIQARLPDVVAGRYQPATSGERLALAELCMQPFEARYALAARLYVEALADTALPEEARSASRFDAILAAAQAGTGQGRDAAGLDEATQAKLRQQAQSWLQADLALWVQRSQTNVPQARATVAKVMRFWQHHTSLAGVRDPAALEKLPSAERQTWQHLWQQVADLRARMTSKGGPST
jgi:tetratricopeptide (TPR) repeat protein